MQERSYCLHFRTASLSWSLSISIKLFRFRDIVYRAVVEGIGAKGQNTWILLLLNFFLYFFSSLNTRFIGSLSTQIRVEFLNELSIAIDLKCITLIN